MVYGIGDNMKKINSTWFGSKVIFTGVILAFIIPVCIKIFHLRSNIFNMIFMISFAFGSVILIGFSILLVIELHQDKKMSRYYEKHKNQMLVISKNTYECQSCGNRQVRLNDESCSICGIHFNKDKICKNERNMYHKHNKSYFVDLTK